MPDACGNCCLTPHAVSRPVRGAVPWGGPRGIPFQDSVSAHSVINVSPYGHFHSAPVATLPPSQGCKEGREAPSGPLFQPKGTRVGGKGDPMAEWTCL
eukprot:15438854-Alexandrium_andersonii.AAC.1